MNGRYRIGDTVLGNWKLVQLIGEGSFGQVFEAEREDFGRIYKAAIKIITIPQSQSEIQSVQADGLDDESVTAYFRGFVEELVDEFGLMSQLKGHSNIVSYEDHTVQHHKDSVGWDIIIRMELLTPLLRHVRENTMTRRDVIKLGIDMCKALELCQKYKIVHRDIKPENIFISPAGDYKLGDFGIARTVEKTTSGLSKKGTYTYMAPEIYRDQPYGTTVDIYSLGVVLYWLLNESRSPFLPPYPAPITHADRENALRSRMSGEPIPAPKNAEGRLAEIVLKACAYDPKDRYSGPMLMRRELEGILYDRKEASVIFPEGDEVPARSVREIPTDEPSAPEDDAERTESVFAAREGDDDDKTVGLFGFSADAEKPEDKTEGAFTPVAEDKTVGLFGGFDEDQRSEEGVDDAFAADEAPVLEAETDPSSSELDAMESVMRDVEGDLAFEAEQEEVPPKKDRGELVPLIAILARAAVLIGVLLFGTRANRTSPSNTTDFPTREKIYNEDGTVARIEYHDEAGNVVRDEVYNTDGTLARIDCYDGAANETQRTRYAYGTLYDVNYYEEIHDVVNEVLQINYYDEDEALMRADLYDLKDGSLKELYYDKYGNVIKQNDYNPDGTLRDSWE